jgi:hypothetical protein
MKLLLILAALSAVAFSQEAAKVAPPAPPPAANTAERKLSEDDVNKFLLAQAQAQLLRSKYKQDDFDKEIAPINERMKTLATGYCRSVGVPEAKILFGQPGNECGLAIGINPDGKAITGADGKPIESRVWWEKPPEVKATEKK